MSAASFHLIDDHLEKIRRPFDARPARGCRRQLAQYFSLHLSSEARVLRIRGGTGALLRQLKPRHIPGAEVAIRGRDRTGGSPKLRRWKHGGLFLRKATFAARKLKFV